MAETPTPIVKPRRAEREVMLKPRKVSYGGGDVPLAKPRKTNFTAREVEVLLNSVRKHRDTVLFGVAGGQGWAQAWMEVAKVVSTVEGIVRTESDVRKKWTYLKWEAKNTSKPGRDPTSRAVLDILTSRNWEGKDSAAASAAGMSLLETLLVPQQAPPGTKQVVAPAPVKKTLPLSSQSSPKPAITKPAPPRPVSPPQPPPPPPEVCLRWNSYHSNMQATFPSLLNNEQFVDVTLACEGRSIKCHKMMLSACSSYFEELLSQNPCQHPIVLMKDLKFWEVQALVDFMYRGEVNVGQDKLPSLLAAAEALQIKGLAGPASTSSSHDEDSLPPTLPLATDDFLDESTSSPSSARRARKRRTIASMPTPRQNTISPHRNPVGRPRLIRPSPQPSTSTYQQASVASEPPLRRARRSEPPSLPLGQEIKIEPVDIDISNDSMDPVDDGFDMNKTYDGSRGGGDANGSSKRPNDVVGGTEGGGKQEITGNLSDDNRTATSRHDSDHMDYGNNNGMNSESTVTPRGGESKTEIQDYSYTEGSTDDPGMSSSDINPTYPEVVVNPRADSASSDSILGHL
ncbi:protein tramtrack, alpha isoform isoform X4 [Cryptotermes secundus]|uniref:protein tramtrack, alpha isoform isoform X4 n=1 Tax=Cryptotermes secundus TaxID=105785 RepID=UPI000CD7DBF1|nr:protein tramtrack, alpha isoform isoform X4 [Cryptotermes secundus]